MIQAPDLPQWAALVTGILLLGGAIAALIGSIGLVRMRSFYDRVHPPTIGSSMGVVLIAAASIVCFSVLRARPSVHEVLIVVFVTLTTPVTFMLLGRAALYRDSAESDDRMPPSR
ncbi:potassium:proton antiporter [Altererythrobacter aerius]|uniref:Potassium:proton antiporter n=1 Tax=Tsuneonella aeria TaxID=1837929 RepID=A0A6I4TE85_9SPHN|nr:monovalent cation/H(+) antiporter subunit G [Tsuneonella aeria]MXO74967.1 potassium:proton antiporter [Tsuneonella aeria]